MQVRTKTDVYQKVTDIVVAAIEAGPGKLVMPWHRAQTIPLLPINATTEQAYNGINIVMLWSVAMTRNYQSAKWATYKQWKAAGYQVAKGEKGSPIIFYKDLVFDDPDAHDANEDGQVKRPMARSYAVFAAEQVRDADGEPYVFDQTKPAHEDLGPVERIARADQYVSNTGARITIAGDRACYYPAADTIHIPEEGRFFDQESQSRSEAFYSVTFHELGHWTSAPKRLDRKLGKRFGSKAYAAEELIAELSAAFLCAKLGIQNQPHPDHAAYIGHWLEIMKADKKAIFTAAAAAQKAVTFLDDLQASPTELNKAA